jgi:hypothetical protein
MRSMKSYKLLAIADHPKCGQLQSNLGESIPQVPQQPVKTDLANITFQASFASLRRKAEDHMWRAAVEVDKAS